MNFRGPRMSQLPRFRSLRQITALCRDRAVLERHDLVPLRHWNIIELGSNLDPLLPGFFEHIPQRAPHPGFLLVVNCHVPLTTVSSSNGTDISLKVTPKCLCSASFNPKGKGTLKL